MKEHPNRKGGGWKLLVWQLQDEDNEISKKREGNIDRSLADFYARERDLRKRAPL